MEKEFDDVFTKYWNLLSEKPSTTLRFFDRQDFFTVHFEDAELIAKSYFKSFEVVKYFKGNMKSPYINISKNSMDGLFRFLLISNQYKIEIYGKEGRDNGWELNYTVSPGNLEKYQELLFGNSEVSSSNSLVAVDIKKTADTCVVYIGYVDLDNGLFMIGGFEEDYNEFEKLANLNSALYHLNCRECLIRAKDNRMEMGALKDTVIRSGLLLSEVSKSSFEVSKFIDMIPKLISSTKFGNQSSLTKLFDVEGDAAVGCLCAVISYLSLGSDDSFLNYFDIKVLQLNNYMKIGEECSNALNLLPSPTDLSRYDSVYGLLNNCKTNLGERLLKQWLKQPLTDVEQINVRLDIVSILVQSNDIRCTLSDTFLCKIPDIQRIIKKIQRKIVTLKDLYRLYVALKQGCVVYNVLSEYEGNYSSALDSEITIELKTILDECMNFISMIESVLDMESIKDHEYKIRSDVNEELTECNASINKIKASMEKEFLKVTEKLGVEPYKQVKFESNSHLGYYMRITRKDECNLRDRKNIIIKETQKDGVKFYSPLLQSLNDEYVRLNLDYEQQQKSVVNEIISIAGQYINALQSLSSVVAKLDVFCSLASVVLTAPGSYVRPTLTNKSERCMDIKLCRHPLVEMQPNISYIANDVDLNDNKTFYIITGPNMGGKSTYIKSIGIAVVLAQIGSFVPAESACISVCDRVMTRIGAGDCQIKGVSTFMAEMLDISWILRNATLNSLIIIDELGRGTSTFDGFGLAWAISEFLAVEKGSFTLFATHFHELTELADICSTVANYHVSATNLDNDITFLYKLKEGPATKSYGIDLAKAVGLPNDVIEYARSKLDEYEFIVKTAFNEEEKKLIKSLVFKDTNNDNFKEHKRQLKEILKL